MSNLYQDIEAFYWNCILSNLYQDIEEFYWNCISPSSDTSNTTEKIITFPEEFYGGNWGSYPDFLLKVKELYDNYP